MTVVSSEPPPGPRSADDQGKGPPAALLVLISVAVGALVANLYYAQPLVALIAPEIGISPDVAGSIVSVTQIGYALGLLLLVPLADLVENRRLVLLSLGCTAAGLIGTALSSSPQPFFAFAFLIGFCATGAQVLLPFLSHLVPAKRRGRVMGNVMAGVLTGIMLARPVSLFLSAALGWRAVFLASAVLMVAIGLALRRVMPRRRPPSGTRYGAALASMGRMIRDMSALRWRCLYQTLMFGAFNLFWTAAPLMLSKSFGLGAAGIGWFSLAGAGGALAAPLAGRLADRGLGHIASPAAMALLAFTFVLSIAAVNASALYALALLAVLLDAAMQTSQVVAQRFVFSVPAEVRGRANAIFVTMQFAGGAAGSMLATVLWHAGGWPATALTGAAAGFGALVLCILEGRLGKGSSIRQVRPEQCSH